MIGMTVPCQKSSAQSKDYRSQVLFIYNFIKYINWPVGTENFVIGIVGNSPITNELNKLASVKKTPDGKPIIIKVIEDASVTGTCDMIYLSDARSKDIASIIAEIHLRPALVVAERDGLTKKGAEISFFTQDDGKLSFSISRKNMESKKLKVSGELLRLAELAD